MKAVDYALRYADPMYLAYKNDDKKLLLDTIKLIADQLINEANTEFRQQHITPDDQKGKARILYKYDAKGDRIAEMIHRRIGANILKSHWFHNVISD